jgi:hypothetical protein
VSPRSCREACFRKDASVPPLARCARSPSSSTKNAYRSWALGLAYRPAAKDTQIVAKVARHLSHGPPPLPMHKGAHRALFNSWLLGDNRRKHACAVLVGIALCFQQSGAPYFQQSGGSAQRGLRSGARLARRHRWRMSTTMVRERCYQDDNWGYGFDLNSHKPGD